MISQTAPKVITVRHFYEKHGEKLKLELLAGEDGLDNVIREGSINRPSLALTGFFKYFANKRIQVFGAAEITYFKTLPYETQEKIIHEMIVRAIPCVILTRNYTPPPSLVEASRKHRLPLFRTPMITMNWVNMATLAIDNEFSRSCTEHATTLDVKGLGVMIRGHSGVGKSECALALIERGHSLVADDVTHIRVLNERELVASSQDLNFGFMECRGIGIINIAEMFGIHALRKEKRLDIVISLYEWTPDSVEERTGLEENYYTILDHKIPHIEIYVRPGRDIARLVEVAVMVQALKEIGHNPAQEFNARLIAHMNKDSIADDLDSET